MRRYDSYKDSGVEWIGEIPSNWDKTKLKFSLLKVLTGGTPDTSNNDYWSDEEDGINWISISDITSNGREIFNTKKLISKKGLESKKLEILPIGSLIYSIYGSIGKVSRLGIPSTIHQGILGLQTNSKVDSVFLEYYLIYFKEYVSLFSSSNTQENLNQEKVLSFEHPLPPLSEQQEIVSYLDTKTSLIDSLIEKTKLKIQLRKENRTSLINEVVTKGLNPNVEMKDSGVEWIGEIPSHWVIKKIKHHSEVNVGLVINPSTYFDDEGTIPIITGKNVKVTGIDLGDVDYITEESNELLWKTKIYEDDLVSMRVGYPGRTSVVKESENGINCCSVIITRKSSSIHSKLLETQLNSSIGKVQVELCQGGMGQQVVNLSDWNEFNVITPPLSEQQEIVSYLDEHTQLIDKTISVEERRIELLKEYRQSLISGVVTGKRKVVTYE